MAFICECRAATVQCRHVGDHPPWLSSASAGPRLFSADTLETTHHGFHLRVQGRDCSVPTRWRPPTMAFICVCRAATVQCRHVGDHPQWSSSACAGPRLFSADTLETTHNGLHLRVQGRDCSVPTRWRPPTMVFICVCRAAT